MRNILNQSAKRRRVGLARYILIGLISFGISILVYARLFTMYQSYAELGRQSAAHEFQIESLSEQMDKLQEELKAKDIQIEDLNGKIKELSTKSPTQGISVYPNIDRGGGTYVRKLTMQSTAYNTGTITKTGTRPRSYRTVAVDPHIIPLGTKLMIEGFDDIFVAEDTGGAIRGNIIDIYNKDHSWCINWGRRTITTYIIEWGTGK